ncbi:uncharacterized protein EV422DRAFT_568363 [Fimicolochytrium jonesii]|uniref:uncharacterized protein n=1 Tax=Fimicolochytrium jonesii TaxID=1396493 RepID=UPI0022FED3F2|nr:uncharacterized protein EV422DRAFT_568363 [Fimicolochytrium jonesii]KAI8819909.1 hypothetical protein EV422DRAFT_568363 [Fimicolochytrium jonesii]
MTLESGFDDEDAHVPRARRLLVMRSQVALCVLCACIFPIVLFSTLNVLQKDLRYSYFHHINATAVAEAEAARLRESESYLSTLHEILSPVPVAGSNTTATNRRLLFGPSSNEADPKLCFAIISAADRPQKYVRQSAAFLVGRVVRELMPELDWEIRNKRSQRETGKHLDGSVPSPPLLRPPPVRIWVHNLAGSREHLGIIPEVIDVVEPEAKRRKSTGGADAASHEEWLVNQINDFADALDHAVALKCGITVLVEDDGIVGTSPVRKLLESTKVLSLDSTPLHTSKENPQEYSKCDWAFIKLFYTEFWAGWENSPTDIATLALLGAAAGIVVAGIVFFILQSKNRNARRYLPVTTQTKKGRPRTTLAILVFIYVMTLTILILHASGRQNIAALPGRGRASGLRVTDARASSVAHLYPTGTSSGLPDCAMRTTTSLISYLRDRHKQYVAPTYKGRATPVDLLVDQFAEERGKQRLELQPHLFQHVGAYSSDKGKNQGNFKDMKVSSSFVGGTDVISQGS